MKTLIPAFIFLLLSVQLDAQLRQPGTQSENLFLTQHPTPGWITIPGEETLFELNGTKNLTDSFHPATLVGNESIHEVDRLRYNIFDNVLEVRANEEIVLVDASRISYFLLETGDQKRDFINAKEVLGDQSEGFLEKVYNSSDLEIFIKHEVDRNIEFIEPYRATRDLVSYESKSKVYFRIGDEVHHIKNRRTLREVLNDKVPTKRVSSSQLSDRDFLIELGQQIASI